MQTQAVPEIQSNTVTVTHRVMRAQVRYVMTAAIVLAVLVLVGTLNVTAEAGTGDRPCDTNAPPCDAVIGDAQVIVASWSTIPVETTTTTAAPKVKGR